MKYTKGQWYYKNSKEYPTEFEIMKNEYFIAKTYSGVDGISNSEDNARLISCAPEMLECLINIYKNPSTFPFNYCEYTKYVIEKATGLTIEEVLNDK